MSLSLSVYNLDLTFRNFTGTIDGVLLGGTALMISSTPPITPFGRQPRFCSFCAIDMEVMTAV